MLAKCTRETDLTNFACIRLSNGMACIVDPDRYDELNRHAWTAQYARGRWYAVRKETIDGRQHKIYMHRVVAETPAGLIAHHDKGNGLDNRRQNLQNVTRGEHDRTRWFFTDN